MNATIDRFEASKTYSGQSTYTHEIKPAADRKTFIVTYIQPSGNSRIVHSAPTFAEAADWLLANTKIPLAEASITELRAATIGATYRERTAKERAEWNESYGYHVTFANGDTGICTDVAAVARLLTRAAHNRHPGESAR